MEFFRRAHSQGARPSRPLLLLRKPDLQPEFVTKLHVPVGAEGDLIRITSGAVATSGSYEVYFDRERLAHHIVQGQTGRSPDHALSVTVTAATTMEADALATAVFVLGPDEGVRLINGLDGCECLIMDRQGKQIRSPGWSGSAASGGEPGKWAGGAETGANGRRDV